MRHRAGVHNLVAQVGNNVGYGVGEEHIVNACTTKNR